MIAGVAVPAAAQYGQYPNQYGNQGVVGSVINSVLGNGRYGAYGQGNDRVAVDQCARAAEARVSSDFRAGRYGAYGRQPDRYVHSGNNGNYRQSYGLARVVGITGVERKSNGLKISGVMESGMGYRGGYNPSYDPRYANQGYGGQGYAAQSYNAQSADLRFSCRVDYNGRVSNLDIKRNNGRRI